VVLSESSREEIRRIRKEYPDAQSALLPALYRAQEDYGGWLPEGAFEEVAAEMDLSPALVASVASFYTMLSRKPVGRHLIQICTNISCSLLGSERLVEHVSRKLNVKPGETTADGKFTLLEVECLGACGGAPMMQLDDQYYESLTQDRVDEVLASLE
jgi:NADH-quinone oxidoreductase subunit E